MANMLSTEGGTVLQVGMTFNTQKAQVQLIRDLNKLERKSKIQIPVEVDGTRFVKTVRTFEDSMKNLVQVTTMYNGATGKTQDSITGLTAGFERAERVIKEQEQATQRLNSSQKTLNTSTKKSISIFKDFADTFMKMAKFNTINLIYDGLINSMSEAITVVDEFNRATTELRKVSDLEGESLRQYTQDLIKYGEAVGRTMTDMVNSATIFKRTGATDEEAMKLAQIAELYRNVADSEISSADAASFVVSQMKAFNFTADQSIHIIDAINETANNFAVSTDDLQIALSKSAAALATAGNTYEETIAMVEGATAVMQGNAGTVGNGLRTIAINVANLATKSDEFVAANGKINISLKNARGEIRSTYEILNDLSQGWEDLSTAEQNEIAVALSGKTRYNVLTSLMRNFSDAQQVLQTSLNSTNSAWQENSRYMESIAAKQAKLKAEFEQFVLGKGGLEDFRKKTLDVGISIVQFINNIGGLKSAITLLTGALVIGLLPSVIKFGSYIKSALGFFPALINTFIYAKQAGVGFSVALNEIATAGAMTQMAINGVIAVITLAVIAFNAYKHAQEEARKAAYEHEREALEYTRNIEQQIIKLNDEKQSREELVKTIQEVDSSYKDEGQTIDEINKKRQETIDKIKEESRVKLEEAKNAGFGQYKKDVNKLQDVPLNYLIATDFSSRRAYQDKARRAGITENFDKNLGGAENYLNYLKKIQEYYTSIGESSQKLNSDIENLSKEIDEAKQGVNSYNEILDALNLKYNEETGLIEELTQKEISQKEVQAEAIEGLESISDILEQYGVNIEELADKMSEVDFDKFQEALQTNNLEEAIGLLEQYGYEINNVSNGITEVSEVLSEHIGNLQGVQSAYDTMIGAIQEYNENGYYTADTLAKLNSLTSEQLGILSEQGMSIESVTDAMVDQYNVEKEDIVMKLELAKYADLVALSESYLGEQTAGASNAIVVGGNTASANANKYLELAQAAKQAADAMHQVQAALGMDSDAYKNFEADRKKIVEQYDKTIETVRKSQLDLNKAINGGGGKKGGGGGGSKKGGGGRKGGGSSASKAAKEHEDAWLEAFKNEQKALKHKLELDEITQYEYYQRLKELNEKYFGEISGNHEKYIKEYNENEEEIYKGLKSVYDKVKDYLQKAVEQGYEKAINTLEKEEKAVLSGIKKKIDSLKKEKDNVLDGIQKEIDMLEKQRDETLDGIHKEIDTLKKQKEEVEKYWNDQIDAIKRENEEIQEQNQLLEYQQALQQAKSQKVMVYQDGRFQLTENESAVADAEKALAEYEDQLSYEQQIRQMEDLRDAQIETLEERIEALESYYEYMEEYYAKQIEALEEYKEYMEEYYDSQIEAMKDYYDRVEEQYEKQIEALQSQLDAFKEGCQKAEDLENAKLAATVMAANEEAAVWQQRLENLADAITEYNRLLSLMGEAGVGAESTFSAGTASFTPSSNVNGVNQTIQTRAKGDSSFAKDEIALVGESPNAELVLGSRLNNSVNSGDLVHLSRGSGVVNAESTSTLAGLLNGLSKPTNVANNRSTQQNFTFGNISLPNVTDADSFVNTLSHKFNNYAIQYGNVRK